MKKILITGAAGFAGHHMVDYLLRNTDWEIICLVRMSRAGNLNRLSEIMTKKDYKRIRIVRHDLLDTMDSIHRHIGQVDYIVHMAADSHVDDSIVRRKPVFMNNVLSTVNILEYAAMYQDDLERFIYYSTDEVYGDAYNSVACKENDALFPRNPYSGGKAAGEMAVEAWRNTTLMPLIIMRTMNMFGERQDPEKMIPKTIGRYLKGLPAIVHSNNGIIGMRHWLYTQNSASAVKFCLENRLDITRINVAGDIELSNLEIAHKISDIMGLDFKYEMIEASKIRPGYDRRYSVDDSLIRSLGWEPEFDFETMLEKTVKFSIENPDWVK